LRQSQKMEAIGRLTGGIAHDFNNMLQVMMGRIERLRRARDDSRPVASRDLDALEYATDRAASLTHRLLAFSRQQALQVENLDVNRVVAGMSDLLRRTLGETIAFETVLAGGLWRTETDANQLESALLNLAVNARDAMPEQGKLTVETANAYLDEAYAARHEDVEPGQYVMVAVTDTGTGMTSEVIAQAFDPFFTTKPSGVGTGLGLSMVYGFAKQSGGHVKIYSEQGVGTTVKLYLPRARAAEQGAAVGEEPAPALLAPNTDGRAILVVEDEEEVRAYAVDCLAELGYRVLEAGTADEGLAILAAHPEIDLLFTDVVLPGDKSGRELADMARAQRPDLKVLFMTGYTRNAIVHHGRLDPDVQLITKPFTSAALLGKVRAVLAG
jgi:CheY-like chemotaxis protein